jgi:chaperonin GroES
MAEQPTGIVKQDSVEVSREGTRVRPLGDRVFVLEDTEPQSTRSGIVLPDNAQLPTRRGRVVAFGPGLRSPLTGEPTPLGLTEGDRVIFSPMTGIEVTVDGLELLVLREVDIISVYTLPEDRPDDEQP